MVTANISVTAMYGNLLKNSWHSRGGTASTLGQLQHMRLLLVPDVDFDPRTSMHGHLLHLIQDLMQWKEALSLYKWMAQERATRLPHEMHHMVTGLTSFAASRVNVPGMALLSTFGAMIP